MPTVDRVLPWRRQPSAASEIETLLEVYHSRHPRGDTALIRKS